MPSLPAFLRSIAPIFVIVGAVHLILGVRADELLGARLSAEVLADPVLNSQNRFYGVAFSIYGVLLWVGAGDLRRYATVLRCLLWVFFAGGLARVVDIAIHGPPSALVIALLTTEILLPPLLHVWLSRSLRR